MILMALMIKTNVGWGQICGVRNASLNLEREINGTGTKNVSVRWHLVRSESCANGLDIEFTNQLITGVEQIFANHGIILNRVSCDEYQYGIIPVCSDLLFNSNQICDFTSYCNSFALNVFLIPGDGEGLAVTPGNLCYAKINTLSHKNVVAHEIGHCFGLFHTSHGRPYWISLDLGNFWSCTNQGGVTGYNFLNSTCTGRDFYTDIPFEKVNGTNSRISGDFVFDTPADISLGSGNCSPATNCTTSSSCAEALDGERRKDPNCERYNVPWDNIMRHETTNACQTIFTIGQVSRMKGVISSLVNYVESEPCMVCNSVSGDFCSPCHPAHEHITNYNITGNVTYNNPRLATQIINVKAGGKLTITNFVYFSPGLGINVESGGTLDVSGGHLTACGINWGGVSMVRGGNVNIINGGTISKALFGVYKLSSNSGGILTCNNAHFYDNYCGVLFSQSNGSATFQNSTFTGMGHGVYLDNLPGKTTFSDCTFAYQAVNGITSFGSGIDVSSNNTFTGSDNGIAAYNLFGTNTQSKIGDELLANTISNCNKGVYAVNAELLIRNNYLQDNSFSLYYSGQNIFQSTANTFSGASYAEGIYSTGNRSNQSHDNQYNSDVGIFPYLHNGGYTFYNNCFRTQWWDVNVPAGAQINIAQEGPGGSAASNCFTKGSVPDFICETSQPVIYKVPNSPNAPKCLTPETPGNYVLDPVDNSNNLNCGAGIGGGSEYDYLKRIGCDSLKLHRKIDSLNSIVKVLKNKTIPLTTAEKSTLAKTERHLRYAINQWAWCLRNRGKRSQLKEWYTTWSIEFPDDTYYKIKRAEVSVESGQYTLAKAEIDTLKTLYPSMSVIWDALKVTVDVLEAIDAVSLQQSMSEPENTPYQEIAKVYTLTPTNRNLLRRVAAMSTPEAAYGRALLAYLTGEQIEPKIDYTVIPRTTRPEKDEQLREVIQILPNPTQDYLSISIKNLIADAQYSYQLANITGQKVMEGLLTDHNELNVTRLSQGMYIMILYKDNTRLKTDKLIIQK